MVDGYYEERTQWIGPGPLGWTPVGLTFRLFDVSPKVTTVHSVCPFLLILLLLGSICFFRYCCACIID